MTLLIIKDIPFYELNELEFPYHPSKENEELELLLLTEKVKILSFNQVFKDIGIKICFPFL